MFDAFNIDEYAGKIQTFEGPKPIIEDLIMTFRNYSYVAPYIKFCLSPDRETEEATVRYLSKYGIPGGCFFMSRILEKKLDTNFENLVKANYDLLNFYDEFRKIETGKKFFIEGALGSLKTRVNLSQKITVTLFTLEVKRLGLDIKELSDNDIKLMFNGLFRDFKHASGEKDYALLAENLKAARSIVNFTRDTKISELPSK